MIIDKLNKYRSSHRSFGWSICSLRYFTGSKTRQSLIPYLASMLILGKTEGNAEFFENMGFAGLLNTHSITCTIEPRGIKYLEYLYDLLEDPKRSGDCALNGQMFANAVGECLELYLCNRHLLQKQRSQFDRRHATMRRTTPWLWRVRFGTRNAYHRNHPRRKTRAAFNICRRSRALAPPGIEAFQIALYEWALIVFPFFLERSTVSLKLADHLSRSTFSIVSARFPYLTRLAKVAILKYSIRAKALVSHS